MIIEAETLTLVAPSLDYAPQFHVLLDEYRAVGEQYDPFLMPRGTDLRDYVRRTERLARGTDLVDGWVPMSTFWLVRGDGAILGVSRLRHRLTEALTHEGGHIGYMIRPGERRKGYGTRILALTLEKARWRGLGRVLVTCDTDNTGSTRIIVKNGGVLEDEVISRVTGKRVSRYWIALAEIR